MDVRCQGKLCLWNIISLFHLFFSIFFLGYSYAFTGRARPIDTDSVVARRFRFDKCSKLVDRVLIRKIKWHLILSMLKVLCEYLRSKRTFSLLAVPQKKEAILTNFILSYSFEVTKYCDFTYYYELIY